MDTLVLRLEPGDDIRTAINLAYRLIKDGLEGVKKVIIFLGPGKYGEGE